MVAKEPAGQVGQSRWRLGRPDPVVARWWRARARREQRGHHAPELWSVWAAAPIVLVVGGIAVWLLYLQVYEAAIPVDVPGARPRVDSLDAIRTTLSLAAFVGALLAGLYAYRKQRLAEGDAARADAAQFSDRYTKAAEQLGSDKSAIRLAGVYAMAHLADDWLEQRQTCIDVLCAYLRMPYVLPSEPEHRPGQSHVRATIVQVIAGHLKFEAAVSWSRADFDLTGAHLENVDFRSVSFSGVTLFDKATFSGDARFNRTTFSGIASFDKATFSSSARFDEATFCGDAWFNRTTFSGTATFDRTTFSGTSWFNRTTFPGTASFDQATFSGAAWFEEATFADTAWFDRATFSDTASFDGASFTEPPAFDGVTGLERATGLPKPPKTP